MKSISSTSGGHWSNKKTQFLAQQQLLRLLRYYMHYWPHRSIKQKQSLPPSNNNIQALKIKNVNDVNDVNVDAVYALFREKLGSVAIRKQLFDKMNLVDQFAPERDETANLDEIFKEFNKNIALTIPNPKKGKFALPTTTFSLEERDPKLIADIVNRLANDAQQAAISELISNIDTKVKEQIKEVKLEIKLLLDKTKKQRLDEIERLETSDALKRSEIEDKIKSLRNAAKDKRLDRIAELTEASEIAHSLGIKNPLDYKLKKISDSSIVNSQIMTDVSSKSSGLYSLGYEALEAEIATLSKRSNDDPFVNGLRTLEEKFRLLEYNRKAEQLKNRTNDAPFIAVLREKENNLAYFESIKIDPKNIKVAHLDQAAFPPEKKIKPKRKLIVVLGLVLGLILGIIIAFFRNLKPKT